MVRGGPLGQPWMASGALVMCPGGENLGRVLVWFAESPEKDPRVAQSDREAG